MQAVGPCTSQYVAVTQQWRSAYDELHTGHALDSNFAKAVYEVEQHLGLLKRQPAVRVKQWLCKLSEPTSNLVWKRTRNQHARLLLHQLRQGRLEEPFHRSPAQGPLASLPPWATYCLATRQPVQRHGVHASVLLSPRWAVSEEARDAAGSLEQYLGRQHSGASLPAPRRRHAPAGSGARGRKPRAQHDRATDDEVQASGNEERGLVLHSSGEASVSGTGEDSSASQQPRSPAHRRRSPGRSQAAAGLLAGTRMQLAGGRRAAAELGEEGWQASKLELVAALGASRERALELEWRLRQAQGALRENGVVPSAVGRKGHGAGGVPRRDLDKVIDKFEQRQADWAIPRSKLDLPQDPAATFSNFEQQTALIREKSRTLDGVSLAAALSPEASAWSSPSLAGLAAPDTGAAGLASMPSLAGGGLDLGGLSGLGGGLASSLGGPLGGGLGASSGYDAGGGGSTFAKSLEDFQRETDALRQQISAIGGGY